jgi:hypothetical protein
VALNQTRLPNSRDEQLPPGYGPPASTKYSASLRGSVYRQCLPG